MSKVITKIRNEVHSNGFFHLVGLISSHFFYFLNLQNREATMRKSAKISETNEKLYVGKLWIVQESKINDQITTYLLIDLDANFVPLTSAANHSGVFP